MKGLHNPQALLERKVMSCFILVFKPMLLNLGTSVSCARYFSSVRRLKTGFCVTVTLEWFINQAMFNSQNKEKICWISLCFHLGFQPMKRRPIDIKGKCFKKTCSQSGSYPQVSCWYYRYMEEIFWRVGELCYRLHLSTKNVFLSVEKVSRAMVNTHWKLGCIRQISVHKCALFFLQTFQTFQALQTSIKYINF